MPDLLPPPEVILAWPLPNYTNPQTRGRAVLFTAWVLGSIMICTVAARIWARAVIQRNAGIDDWLILAAMIPAIGVTIAVCLATEHFGYNRHIWDVHPSLYIPERKMAFVTYFLYVIGTGMIKVSILLFYRRLDSRTISRTFRIATWITIISIVGFVISFILVLCLACQPLSAFWNRYDLVKLATGYKYHCGVDEAADLIAASIISAVQDAITAFLPTILYWNLRIPRRQKMALSGIFALGYLVCATAAARAYYTWRTFNSPVYDVTWEAWSAFLLCMVEIQLGAICASAPALKVFCGHYFRVVATKVGSSGQASSTRSPSWMKMSAVTDSRASRVRRNDEGFLRTSEERGLGGVGDRVEDGEQRTSTVEEPRIWRF